MKTPFRFFSRGKPDSDKSEERKDAAGLAESFKEALARGDSEAFSRAGFGLGSCDDEKAWELLVDVLSHPGRRSPGLEVMWVHAGCLRAFRPLVDRLSVLHTPKAFLALSRVLRSQWDNKIEKDYEEAYLDALLKAISLHPDADSAVSVLIESLRKPEVAFAAAGRLKGILTQRPGAVSSPQLRTIGQLEDLTYARREWYQSSDPETPARVVGVRAEPLDLAGLKKLASLEAGKRSPEPRPGD